MIFRVLLSLFVFTVLASASAMADQGNCVGSERQAKCEKIAQIVQNIERLAYDAVDTSYYFFLDNVTPAKSTAARQELDCDFIRSSPDQFRAIDAAIDAQIQSLRTEVDHGFTEMAFLKNLVSDMQEKFNRASNRTQERIPEIFGKWCTDKTDFSLENLKKLRAEFMYEIARRVDIGDMASQVRLLVQRKPN